MVNFIGKIYDPFGFLAPATVRFKIVLQRLCQLKIGWDCDLPEELAKEWRVLMADLNEAGPISIPRRYVQQVALAAYTLCGFCDVSMRAYAAVIYLRSKTDSSVMVRFVVAKTRVAPLQTQMIPRLELPSALLLSKLMASVADSLKPNLGQVDIRCYTDSQVALHWISGTSREWKPFVQNRVKEIRNNIHPGLWKHCPGKSNPADLPSRGLSALEVSVNPLWRQGPEWLRTDVEPCVEGEPSSMPEECVIELRREFTQSLALVNIEPECVVSDLIDCERYSNLTKLLRVTAQVLRAVEAFKSKQSERVKTNDVITSARMAKAELLWVRAA